MIGLDFMFVMFTQMFIWYWHANEILVESTAISDAVFKCDFVEFPISIKKKLQMIMLRAQDPVQVSIGHWTQMDLDVFQTLLKTAYSIFNVMRNFKKSF